MKKTDRRVQRTRELLQRALLELIRERGYAELTVQDIVERANVGRTTFYLHYTGKDELFMSCHEAMVGAFQPGHGGPQSREELLAAAAPPGLTAAFQHLVDARPLLLPLFQGQENPTILRRMRSRSAQELEARLRAAFGEAESRIPLDVLASYLAGAHLALVQWWLEQRRPHPPEAIAEAFHRLQRAAIRDAFGVGDGS